MVFQDLMLTGKQPPADRDTPPSLTRKVGLFPCAGVDVKECHRNIAKHRLLLIISSKRTECKSDGLRYLRSPGNT